MGPRSLKEVEPGIGSAHTLIVGGDLSPLRIAHLKTKTGEQQKVDSLFCVTCDSIPFERIPCCRGGVVRDRYRVEVRKKRVGGRKTRGGWREEREKGTAQGRDLYGR
jgi:hypothetical protein